MTKQMNKLILSLSILVVAGCAGAPMEPQTAATTKTPAVATKTSTVEERAQRRWDLMLAGRLEGAYDMLTATSREAVSLDQYRSGNRGTYWEKVVVTGKNCDGDVCEVELEMTYNLRDITGLKRQLKESWVKSDDQWYLIYVRKTSKTPGK
jgi:hypothetical protein